MVSRRDFFLSVSAGGALRAQQRSVAMFGNAEAYERFMGRWSRQVAPLLVQFAEVPDSGRVLDVGSGTGALSFELARTRSRLQVDGVDLSEEYIAFADSRNPYPDRLTFQQGDAQSSHFANRSFDASLSLLVFNFIPEPARALAELRRVTKPQGRISAAVWDYGGDMRMLRVFWNAATRTDPRARELDESLMPLCRAGDLARLWRLTGLRDVQDRALDTRMIFENFSDYWEPFLLGQGPAGAYVQTLDRARTAALRHAVRQELKVTDEDRPFQLRARAWAVRGSVPA